ncbi:hypothetical protein Hanom_Chr13g01193101 [Helianthus anomalus]
MSRQRSSTKPCLRPCVSVNHALVTWFWFINQTWVSVFLGIKNTEVRAYRTDPVQVRSCIFLCRWSLYTYALLHFVPMWVTEIIHWNPYYWVIVFAFYITSSFDKNNYYLLKKKKKKKVL